METPEGLLIFGGLFFLFLGGLSSTTLMLGFLCIGGSLVRVVDDVDMGYRDYGLQCFHVVGYLVGSMTWEGGTDFEHLRIRFVCFRRYARPQSCRYE